MIIGISGKTRSGKRTLASYLAWQLKGAAIGSFRHLAVSLAAEFSALPIEQFLDEEKASQKRIFVNGEYISLYEYSIRLEKQIRSIDEDAFIRMFFAKYFSLKDKHTLIVSLRYPNECKVVSQMGGFIIRINRPDELRNPDSKIIEEEDLLEKYDFDYTIHWETDNKIHLAEEVEKIHEILKSFSV